LVSSGYQLYNHFIICDIVLELLKNQKKKEVVVAAPAGSNLKIATQIKFIEK
jgi:hypothetical protein